jgi:hypothetical protein
MLRFRKEAEKVARDWFSYRGVRRPTEEQVRILARRPQVLQEAKRRIAALSAWLAKNS